MKKDTREYLNVNSFAILVTIFLMISCLTMETFATYPKPTKQFYVNDYANVLTIDEENVIYQTAKSLYDNTGAQVVVVTTRDNMQGVTINDYANNLFNTWGIGSNSQNNGVLILLAVTDRKVRVEIGTGLQEVLTDSKVGSLLDTYAVPYYKNDIFNRGTVSLYYAVLNTVRQQYGLNVVENTLTGYSDKYRNTWWDSGWAILLFGIGMFAIPFLVVVWILRFGRYVILRMRKEKQQAQEYWKDTMGIVTFWTSLSRFYSSKNNPNVAQLGIDEATNVLERERLKTIINTHQNNVGGGGGSSGGGNTRNF